MRLRTSLFLVALSLLPFAGCGGSSGSGNGGGGGTTGPTAASNVYVAQNNVHPYGGTANPAASDQILQFSASANGSTSPAATISGPVGWDVIGLAVDAAGSIYVSAANQATNASAIYVYAAGATGSATPTRTITSTTNSLASASIAVDASGQLYVRAAQLNLQVQVYAAGATGAATPTRTFTAASTTLSGGGGIAVDANGNVYVQANAVNGVSVDPAVFIFSATASGSATPARVITGIAAGLTTFSAGTVTLDSAGNIYVSIGPVVKVFAANATGAATATRTFRDSSDYPQVWFAVDATGKIYSLSHLDYGVPGFSPAVLTYPANASGTVTASTKISSSSLTYASDVIAIH